MGICRAYPLNRLSVVPVDIDPDDGLVELGVCRLENRVVGVVLEAKGVKALEDEFEQLVSR